MENLANAGDLFDSCGMEKQAAVITNIIEKTASLLDISEEDTSLPMGISEKGGKFYYTMSHDQAVYGPFISKEQLFDYILKSYQSIINQINSITSEPISERQASDLLSKFNNPDTKGTIILARNILHNKDKDL